MALSFESLFNTAKKAVVGGAKAAAKAILPKPITDAASLLPDAAKKRVTEKVKQFASSLGNVETKGLPNLAAKTALNAFAPGVSPIAAPFVDKKLKPSTAKEDVRTAKEFTAAPALARTTIGFAQSAKKSLTGEPVAPYRPESELGKFLLEPDKEYEGVRPTDESIARVMAKSEEFSKKLGIESKAGQKTAGLFGGAVLYPALTAFEADPVLAPGKKLVKEGAEKIAAKVGKEVAERTAKEAGEKAIQNVSPEALIEAETRVAKRLEQFRKDAGLMATNEGAGVRQYDNQYTGERATSFSQNKAKGDMFRRAKDSKEEATKLLKENDPEFNAMVTEWENLKAGKIDEPKIPDDIFTRVDTPTVPPPSAVDETASLLPGQKKSKFASETIFRSEVPTEQTKDALKAADDVTYTKETNIEQLDEANKRYDLEGSDVMKTRVLKQIDEIKGGDLTADTQTLVKRLQDEGKGDEAVDIIRKFSLAATKSGQLIQAIKAWKLVTPEGMLRFAEKTIQDAKQSRKGWFGDTKVVDKVFGTKPIQDLNKVDTDFITKKMAEVTKLPDGEAKEKAIKEVLERIGSKVPPGASELIDAYRYQNMLSSPRTQMRNIFSNIVQTVISRPAVLAASVPVDFIQATLFGKERTRYLKELPAYYRGVVNAAPNAWLAAKEVWQGTRKIENIDLQAVKNTQLPKGLTVVARGMEGADQFFKTFISSGEYAAAKARGLSDADALKQAEEISTYSLFRSDTDAKNLTGQGRLLSAIDNATDALTVSGKKVPALRWFVPFVRTPMNFAKQWIEYTPGIGLLNLPGSKNKTELLAKQMIGSTIFTTGAVLAQNGRTTWAAPTNAKEKELFYASGKKPYSIKIGEQWVPMSYLGPYALAMGIPAAHHYYQKESRTALTDSQLEVMGRTLRGGVELFANQTFLSGLGGFVKTVSGDEDYTLPSVLGFTASQTLPVSGLVRWVNNYFIDPVYRKSSGFVEQIQKDLPILSKQLPAFKKPTGEDSTRDMKNAILPFDITESDPTYDEALQTSQSISQQRAIVDEQEKEIDRTAQESFDLLKSLSPEESEAVLNDLAANNPQVIDELVAYSKKIANAKDPQNLVYDQYKNLTIANGLRARAIYDKINKLEDPSEFLSQLELRGIIDDTVINQLVELFNETPS